MTQTTPKAPTYSFHKELFNWDGMYLTYGNNSSDSVFIARFKYGKKPYKKWITFLCKNFTVQEYLNASNETSPLKAIEDKGYVDENTMIDTWATVGSCAQIGKNVHLSGGVGIGGVLEPLQATPVVVEDNVFIGSRCIIVEGVQIKKEAVLGANVTITSSTKILDVSGPKTVEHKGIIPERSVVIPGSYKKNFSSGEFYVPCALIIGKRKESTNKKTSLNDALRTHNVSV